MIFWAGEALNAGMALSAIAAKDRIKSVAIAIRHLHVNRSS
jgi:hypothetical protein